MAYVFQQMRQTVQPSGLFGDDGIARSTYEYFLTRRSSTRRHGCRQGLGPEPALEAKWDAAARVNIRTGLDLSACQCRYLS